MRRSGLSFVEILVACALLLVVIVPLGLLLAQATVETRASIDEFYASLYLSEVVEQVASLPFTHLPLTGSVKDLGASGSVLLDDGDERTVLHLTAMRRNFTSRTVEVSSVDLPEECLKQIRATVSYERESGLTREFEMVTYVGRGFRYEQQGGGP